MSAWDDRGWDGGTDEVMLSSKRFLWPDVEIMVYLGILDTRKYFGLQKILTEITAILWRE